MNTQNDDEVAPEGLLAASFAAATAAAASNFRRLNLRVRSAQVFGTISRPSRSKTIFLFMPVETI